MADDGDWLVTAAAADTQDLPRGAYRLHGFVAKAGERHRVYLGTLAVAPDPAAFDNTTARRSHVEEMYELIVARLEGRLPADREQTIIDGTQITRIPIEQLVKLRGIYAELLRQELGGAAIQTVVDRAVL